MVVDVLERAERAILNAFDELDKGKPDHDRIREWIAGAMAASQVARAQVARDAMRLRLGKIPGDNERQIAADAGR